MDNKPQIPTLKESQNEKKGGAPALKIKGLQSGLSLIERLKQFKKKDLAFILAGLGVLFMAPLAEHFMMSPSDSAGDGTMKEGWNTPGRGGSSPFGAAASPYDQGLNGLAPGGTVGSGSDVITPLNVRDPSALVMGPGATQQAPATASASPTTPPPPPPAKEDSKWNDAIAAGKAAASAATKKAALPVPKVPLSAGGLRGLGAVSGGSGSSFSLAPISSNGLASGHVNQSNGLTGTNGSGFKGVARGPGSGGNTGRLEALKNAAANAGGDFNRAGSAATALEAAANRDMSGSGGGGAGEGGGKEDKATSGSQSKDSKSPGESLEFLRQKMQMEKDIAFADELRKSQPCGMTEAFGFSVSLKKGFSGAAPNLECNKLHGEMMKTFMMKGLVEPLTGVMADKIKEWLEPDSATPTFCHSPDDSVVKSLKGKPGDCGSPRKQDAGTQGYCLMPGGILAINGTPVPPGNVKCVGAGDGSQAKKDGSYGGTGGTPGANDPLSVDGGTGQQLGQVCKDTAARSKEDVAAGARQKDDKDPTGTRFAAFGKLNDSAKRLASVKAWSSGYGDDVTLCGGPSQELGSWSAGKDTKALLDDSKGKLQAVTGDYKTNVFTKDADGLAGADKMQQDANGKLQTLLQNTDPSVQQVTQAQTDFDNTFDPNLGKLVETAKTQTQQALDKTAAQETYKDVDADLKSTQDLIAKMRTQVQAARQGVEVSNGMSQHPDLKPFQAQLKAEADRWDKVLTEQQTDMDKQQQARTKLQQAAAQGGAFAQAHQSVVGFMDASGGAAKDALALGPKDGNTYRAKVTQTLQQMTADVTAAEALKTAGKTQEAQQKKQEAVTTAKGALEPLDTQVKAGKDAAGTAQTQATTFIQNEIEPRIGKAPVGTGTPNGTTPGTAAK